MYGLDIVEGECYSIDISKYDYEESVSFINSFDFIGNSKECLNYIKEKKQKIIYGPLKDSI